MCSGFWFKSLLCFTEGLAAVIVFACDVFEIYVYQFRGFFDSYVEIGLSVVVDRGRGSTTTNHEGLVMMVICHSKMGQQGN